MLTFAECSVGQYVELCHHKIYVRIAECIPPDIVRVIPLIDDYVPYVMLFGPGDRVYTISGNDNLDALRVAINGTADQRRTAAIFFGDGHPRIVDAQEAINKTIDWYRARINRIQTEIFDFRCEIEKCNESIRILQHTVAEAATLHT